MNVNETVLYTENGQDHVATVLEIRNLEHHLGKNGEPLLHLGFFSPVMKPGPNGIPVRQSIVGTHQQYDLAQFRLDVAHDSHEFPVELKQGRYPGGRWKAVNKVTAVEEKSEESDEELPEMNSETKLFEAGAETKSGGIQPVPIPQQPLNNNPKPIDKDQLDAQTFQGRLNTSDTEVSDTGLLALKSAQSELHEPSSTEQYTEDHQDDEIGDGAQDENQKSLGVTEGSIR